MYYVFSIHFDKGPTDAPYSSNISKIEHRQYRSRASETHTGYAMAGRFEQRSKTTQKSGPREPSLLQ